MELFKSMLIAILIVLSIMTYISKQHDSRLDKIEAELKEEFRVKNLIVNMAMSNREFWPSKCIGEKGYQNCREEILNSERKYFDDSLGIEFRHYKWTYSGGQNFPYQIVYLRKDSFEYAFPLRDEYEYQQMAWDTIVEPLWRIRVKLGLETQLNMIISRLHLDNPRKPGELQLFITAFNDSLLKVQEFTAKDTTRFKQYLDNELKQEYLGGVRCRDSIVNNINGIISGLKNNDPAIRYFNVDEGWNGVWKYSIVNDSESRLKLELLNKECYMASYY